MPFIEWSEALSVHVPEIDDHHRQFVALINELNDAVAAKQSRAAVCAIIAKLVNYTERHFVDEEALMYRAGYPQLQLHRTAHRRQLNRVLEFKNDIQKSGLAAAQELLLFLKNWVTSHIQEEDAGYGQFVARTKESTQKIPTAVR